MKQLNTYIRNKALKEVPRYQAVSNYNDNRLVEDLCKKYYNKEEGYIDGEIPALMDVIEKVTTYLQDKYPNLEYLEYLMNKECVFSLAIDYIDWAFTPNSLYSDTSKWVKYRDVLDSPKLFIPEHQKWYNNTITEWWHITSPAERLVAWRLDQSKKFEHYYNSARSKEERQILVEHLKHMEEFFLKISQEEPFTESE